MPIDKFAVSTFVSVEFRMWMGRSSRSGRRAAFGGKRSVQEANSRVSSATQFINVEEKWQTSYMSVLAEAWLAIQVPGLLAGEDHG